MGKNIIKKYFLIIYIFFIFLLSLGVMFFAQKDIEIPYLRPIGHPQLEIRSIDTMKYSRDLSREKLYDKSYDAVINKQMADIAATGANYVGIGTPYDEEFRPILERWIKAARKNRLRVWFRGNFSGWEGWFDYPKIDMSAHIIKTEQFILNNSDLFKDGDIFTSCPECENGVKLEWGDQRKLDEYRAFLILEYNIAKESFNKIGKKVNTGYYSMNGDLANVLMDKETTEALGGIVVIDHYVRTSVELAQDIRDLAEKSGGKIVLGEFGVPIPDIHGEMTEEEQSEWIREAITEIETIPEFVGINYWVNVGGSTAIWDSDGRSRDAVKTIKDFYSRK